jgi:hypothetical protein
MFVPGENPGLDKALEKLWLASRQMVWPADRKRALRRGLNSLFGNIMRTMRSELRNLPWAPPNDGASRVRQL